MSLKPNDIIIMDSNIAIKWNNNTESFVSTKELRNMCPCANCSGESDVFGNVYKNKSINITDSNKYKIIRYMNIGHYAIRISWGDGHDAGIYSFDFIKSLDAKK